MLEMDYDTQSEIEIVQHICWEDLKKSKFVIEIILSEFGKGFSSEKLYAFEAILRPLLGMKDSLQNTRIILALSPFSSSSFSYSYSNPKPLLAHIHEIHNSSPKYAIRLIQFILNMTRENQLIWNYLGQQKKELNWLEQFLESRLNVRTPMISRAGSDNELEDDLDDPKDDEKNWKKENVSLTYNSLKKFISECGVDEEPNFDREKELVEKIDTLKDEVAKLKAEVDFYRSKFPDLVYKKPGLELAGDDDDTEDEGVHNMNDDMDTELSYDANEKAKRVLEIFPDISMQAAILALKKWDFDVDIAVGQLMEGNFLAEVMKEAEESSPNKKQKN
eukprot:TRINITY_DN8740_c0_g1_i1.p1 TRINITY_DN8740_c0_g1~~TRINITY_DN8740_c0_g1_i1.p1  ORF type:complete len:333 (+),score=117.14 TRINITY_DN8740_c0_g1_i1:634-1632(+)